MKSIKLAALFFLLVFCYLVISYIRFYRIIGDADLKSPYSERLLILQNPQAKGLASYVALGDSLTAGVGSQRVTETFVYQYALSLSKKYNKVTLINLGLPGGTTVDVMNDQLPQTIAEKPDYITLLIGINDLHNKRTLASFRKNYWYILTELLSKTNAQITVINIPYLVSKKTVYPPFNLLLNLRTKQFNKIISDLIDGTQNNNRIKLIDLYDFSHLLPKQYSNYYSSDLFHPSSEGYLLWGQIIHAD